MTKTGLVLGLLVSACTAADAGQDAGQDSGSGDAGDSGSDEASGSGSDEGGDTTGGPSSPPTLPPIDGVEFVDVVDNPFLPLPVGASWEYDAVTEEGTEHVVVTVTMDTETIEGVVAVVVRDTATLDGVVIEDTWDWFAQDVDGNVWYLGEDTCEFEDGTCVDHHGTWKWGVDGALPGIVMPAQPAVDGKPYYEEYLVGEAEDAGEVIGVDVHVDVAAGSFDGCVKTEETSTLDLSVLEYKTFCPGVGLVLTEEADVDEELVSYTVP
jgi:hypothetical protein